MSERGYIKIDRKIMNWRYYNDPDMLALWVHILLNAYWTEGYSQGEEVKRGQFWTTYQQLGQELRFGISKIKRALTRLENEKQIKTKSTNRKTLITVVNYDIFQDTTKPSEKPTKNKTENQRKTNEKQGEKQTKNTLIQKKLKKEEVKEINKYIYGEFENVQLKAEEFQKLVELYSEETTNKAIEYLSAYKEEKGYKTKSDYLTIRRWVIDAVQEKKTKAKVGVPNFMREPIKEGKKASNEQLKKIKEMQEEMKR